MYNLLPNLLILNIPFVKDFFTTCTAFFICPYPLNFACKKILCLPFTSHIHATDILSIQTSLFSAFSCRLKILLNIFSFAHFNTGISLKTHLLCCLCPKLVSFMRTLHCNLSFFLLINVFLRVSLSCSSAPVIIVYTAILYLQFPQIPESGFPIRKIGHLFQTSPLSLNKVL